MRTNGIIFLLVALLALLPGAAPARQEANTAAAPLRDDAARIEQAFRAHQSDVPVQVHGRVIKVLADDRKGRRHQRFILRLSTGRTVLVAHNIELAPRVPVQAGEEVLVRGEYEWNQKGGVIHWTHHAPNRDHPGGWIKHRGNTYQ